ncbi:MAG: S9 family peptidase [Candidatus Eisenbacteria bacterium]|nr:S9 family peptidase [Candidatus Eisenbacteria bacterium]
MTLRSAAAVAALITSLSAGPLLGEERDSNTMNLMDDKNPPVAKVVPHPVTIHGDTRADDYFWIRDDKRQDPEVLGYLEAENNYTARVMKPTEAMQQRIFEEIKGRVKETDLTVPYLDNDYFYYSRTEAGKQYAIYCRKTRSLDAPEEIYCDQNEMAKGHDYFSLGVKNVSPNGQLMAFSTDTNGSESYRLQFRDLTTGKLYPEAMSEVDNVAWANDNRHLFYTTRDPAKRTYRVWRHELDTPAANDVLLYQEDDALYDIYLAKTRSDGFILFGSASSTTSECRVIPADQPLTAPRLVEPRQEDIEYYVDHRGDTFYIRTNQDAKNFKIVTAPVATPDASHWTELLAHRPAVKIEDIDIFQDFWVSVERSRGLGQLRVTSFREGISHDIEFPDAAYAVSPSGNAEFVTSAYRFSYQAPTTPNSVYDYDPTSRQRTLRKQVEVLGGFDPANYQSERIYARAYDGAEIPITIISRKGTPRDGTAPLLLYGYGSYGLSSEASFSSARISLLDRGVIWAIANIRGGGELGEEWHDQGKTYLKRNTFTDFITAGEYLVARRFTSTDRMAAMGGSAGGLLIGAVANMRPDLFHCLVAKVPFVDVMNTMLDPTLPLTVGEYLEWGDPNVAPSYHYMRSYCPYTNVAPQRYPAMLITTGLNDPRVGYWEGAKWVARLRANKLDDNLLLMRTNMGAGHAGQSGRYDAWKEVAFDYAFLLSQFGISS